jgi:diguanylate cyclase (GGDEF)-like protein/PAS domain S-box-containing protein
MPQDPIADGAAAEAPAPSTSAQSDHAPGFDALARRQGGNLLDMAERIGHIGSWTIDLPGNRLTHSNEFAAILGVAAGTPITLEEMAARFTPEWRKGIRSLIENCGRNGSPFDEEMQILATGKTRKWVRTFGEAVHGESGQIVRIQGVLKDISDRKQAQRETLRLAMRLTTTLTSITEAFVTLDRQCCFTYLNQESERLLQRSTGDLLGKEVWQNLGDDVGQRMKQLLQQSLAANHRVEFEDFCPNLGKWLEVRAYPFAEGLAVYFRDVTERRKSQEQLMLLETSISRLNDIVLIAEALHADELEPRIVFVNDAFERHTGYGRDDVLGQTPHMLLGPDPQLGKLRRMATALQQKRQVRGELMIHKKGGSWFWVELEVVSVLASSGELTHWVAVGRDITERKAAEDEIHHLAFYDALTELPNRQLLLDRLQHVLVQSVRTRRQGALMFIDLDNFKTLNDTLGHHKGDLLLQKIAVRLSACVRKIDTVARLGGDEFVVLLEDLGEDPYAAAARARIVAEKVLNELREPFDLDGHQHYATSSIGVTSLNGQQGSVSELLKQADLAMYQAKTLGRNTVCFFDPDMQSAVSAKAAVSSDLRIGLQEQQFLMYYQPQVDLLGRVTGVEALLRWKHPERGLVAPAEFIPAAEDTGLILPLGQWALETACEQLAAWAARTETAGLSIAVNVSIRQFRHPDFVDMVMAAIQRNGIRPQRLKLELTESLLADRMEITLAKMGSLKALGVTLSIDDFGMGYSSLSMLKRLPLDQLKIDKSFVADVLTDPNDAAIARTIVGLAQSLGLAVMAEGVETEAQRDFLARHGCESYQGYLFCKALPIDELEAFMQGIALQNLPQQAR